MYIHIHLYMYVYMHVHIHLYIYIYTHITLNPKYINEQVYTCVKNLICCTYRKPGMKIQVEPVLEELCAEYH